jgi:fumarate reductase subunit D
MAKSNEPLWWAPFFAGAGLSALLMPVILLILIIAGLGGMPDLWAVLDHSLIRIVLFVLISLSLFHAAHRIRYILVDLGLKAVGEPIALSCYGSAIVGTILAALLALKLL